jgi:hypothetical protein
VGIAPASGNNSKNAAPPFPFPLPCKIKEAWMQPASTCSAGTSRQIPSARSENAPKRRVNPYCPERFMTGKFRLAAWLTVVDAEENRLRIK